MGREERQSLLHEGTSNQTTMSAFVEIVFDSKFSPTSYPPFPVRPRSLRNLNSSPAALALPRPQTRIIVSQLETTRSTYGERSVRKRTNTLSIGSRQRRPR